MPTALDCAILAEDIYHQTIGGAASSAGWSRVHSQVGNDGFAGASYVRGIEFVTAFRGTETDDRDDLIGDAYMIPHAPPESIQQVIPSLLQEYDLNDRVELEVGGALLGGILSDWTSRLLVGTYANQVPPEQTQRANDYISSLPRAPGIVTGHSLGGALAKAVSLNRNIPCLAFNSPYMGDLMGIPPVTSVLVRSINTERDPLSLATRAAGNLSHGQTILVQIPTFPESPPQQPAMASYTRPTFCPRSSGGSGWVADMIVENLIQPTCEEVVDAWEPVGRARNTLRYAFDTYPEYVSSLLLYLGNAALYYHSMSNLLQAMRGLDMFRVQLLRG